MILEIIGDDQPFWENSTFLFYTNVVLFVIFAITFLFILESLIRRAPLIKKRKLRVIYSLGTITITYFILMICFVFFLYLLCTEGICEFADKKIHDIILIIVAIIANFGMIQRKSSRICFYSINYIFSFYNLSIAIYLISKILTSCNFK